MVGFQDKTVLVIDNGLFCAFAELLAKHFGTVLYWTPWVSAYPKSNMVLMGDGLPGVTRIREFWSIIDDVDLFFFPDVYFGEMQVYLESIGKRVWGSRTADQFELDRVGSKQVCKQLGIPIGPYEVVKGLEALRDYLKEHKQQWVKISTTRGDMETFYSKSYKLIEPRLDELEHKLGAKKLIMQFIVEEAIEPAIEAGYDGYCINGEFPQAAMFGVEVKNKGYLLKSASYEDVPKGVRLVNSKLAPAFKQLNYRGFWSSEIRITNDGTPYLIDPCPRMGSPPNELYQIMVSNWPEIIWEGAEGNLVEPDFVAPWGAELLLISQWADTNWQAVEFPAKLRDQVQLFHACVIKGRNYIIPQWTEVPEIGAVAAVGQSKEEAIKNCRAIAEKVEGYYVEFESDCLDDAAKQLDKLMAMDNEDEPELGRAVAP